MLRWRAATGFEHATETNEIAVHVRRRIFQAVADAGLRAEVSHVVRFEMRDQSRKFFSVREVLLHEPEFFQRLEFGQARALQRNVVVVAKVVYAEHIAAFRHREAARHMITDEAGGAGHENFHSPRDTPSAGTRLAETSKRRRGVWTG